MELVSGDADLVAEAVRSGRSPEGRGELPRPSVLPGHLHPDHTGTSVGKRTF